MDVLGGTEPLSSTRHGGWVRLRWQRRWPGLVEQGKVDCPGKRAQPPETEDDSMAQVIMMRRCPNTGCGALYESDGYRKYCPSCEPEYAPPAWLILVLLLIAGFIWSKLT